MNPLITKAIDMLPTKKHKIVNMLQDDDLFNLCGLDGITGYNQALSDCKHSFPLIFKMIQEEIEKLPAFTSCSDKTMGQVSDNAKKPKYGTNYLERETIINLLSLTIGKNIKN